MHIIKKSAINWTEIHKESTLKSHIITMKALNKQQVKFIIITTLGYSSDSNFKQNW